MEKKRKTEPDLYVINKKPTTKELDEFKKFVEEHRKKLNKRKAA